MGMRGNPSPPSTKRLIPRQKRRSLRSMHLALPDARPGEAVTNKIPEEIRRIGLRLAHDDLPDAVRRIPRRPQHIRGQRRRPAVIADEVIPARFEPISRPALGGFLAIADAGVLAFEVDD